MYPILRTYGYHEILSLNFSFIATLIGIIAILLNGIFIPIIWNEIGNVWREFDQEIWQIKVCEFILFFYCSNNFFFWRGGINNSL